MTIDRIDITAQLFALQDKAYADFQSKLLPTVKRETYLLRLETSKRENVESRNTKKTPFRMSFLRCGRDSNSRKSRVKISLFLLTINQLVSKFKYHFTLGRFGQILGSSSPSLFSMQRYCLFLTYANFEA